MAQSAVPPAAMPVVRAGLRARAFTTASPACTPSPVPPARPRSQPQPSPLPHDGDSDHSKAHPYNVAEFRAPTELDEQTTFLTRHPVASGLAGLLRLRHVPHSWYYRDLVQRLEVAQMQDRLRTAQLDIFHQRFWNTRPLHVSLGAPSPLAQIPSAQPPPPPPAPAPPAPPADADTHPQTAIATPPLPSVQPVGALDALFQSRMGSARAREYNRALFKQLLPKLRPSWEFAWLRAWTKIVRRCERILGWGP